MWIATIFGYVSPEMLNIAALNGENLSNRFFKIGSFGSEFANFNVGLFGYLAYIYLPLLLIVLYRFYDDTSYSFKKVRLTFGYILLFICLLILQALMFKVGFFGTFICDLLEPYIKIFGIYTLVFLGIIASFFIISQKRMLYILEYLGETNKMFKKSLSSFLKEAGKKLKDIYVDFNMDYLQRANKKMLNLQYSEIVTMPKSKYTFECKLVEPPLDSYANEPKSIEVIENFSESTNIDTNEVDKNTQDIQDLPNQIRLKTTASSKQNNTTQSYINQQESFLKNHIITNYTPKTQMRMDEEDVLQRFQNANIHVKTNTNDNFNFKEDTQDITIKLKDSKNTNVLESFVNTKTMLQEQWLINKKTTTPKTNMQENEVIILKKNTKSQSSNDILNTDSNTLLDKQASAQIQLIQSEEKELQNRQSSTLQDDIKISVKKIESKANLDSNNSNTSITQAPEINKINYKTIPENSSYKVMDMSFTKEDSNKTSMTLEEMKNDLENSCVIDILNAAPNEVLIEEITQDSIIDNIKAQAKDEAKEIVIKPIESNLENIIEKQIEIIDSKPINIIKNTEKPVLDIESKSTQDYEVKHTEVKHTNTESNLQDSKHITDSNYKFLTPSIPLYTSINNPTNNEMQNVTFSNLQLPDIPFFTSQMPQTTKIQERDSKIQNTIQIKNLDSKNNQILDTNTKIQTIQNVDNVEQETYILPPVTLLKEPIFHNIIEDSEIDSKIENLLAKLRVFKIRGDIVSVFTGPVVTTFEFRPESDVKVAKVLSLQDDLAMSLKARNIRIQAPIPGKDVIGIEIPNNHTETIYLRDILESSDFLRGANMGQDSNEPLKIILGKDIVGNPVIENLAKLPHLLVAGTTGSGKSVGVNTLILSLLYRNNPKNLRLMMIDPKKVEFAPYEDLPHLITPVINTPQKAIKALQVATEEMDKRYEKLKEMKTKNIISYNEKSNEKMPYFVIIIDELAELMATGGKEAEGAITQIAQMGRAAGMHLIIATQRSSVNVVTGTLKANLPARLSYRVGNMVDSKVVIDSSGAERLLGNGDGLFVSPFGLRRIHSPFVSEKEIDEIVDFIKSQGEPQYDEKYGQDDNITQNAEFSGGQNDLISQAKEIILRDQKTSISYVQRKLGIGFNKAADIMEMLEKEGFISPPDSKGKRNILG